MISTIIFDLGGVLFTNGAGLFVQYLAERYHYKEALLDAVIHGPTGSAYRSGSMSSGDFWKIFKASFPLPLGAAELERIWEFQYELIEETREIILELRKKYRVYYLSDTVKKRVDNLQKKYRFLTLFEGGVFSHEAGIRKPNPEIYKKVLARAGVSGTEAVFIDDKAHNLAPAAALGIHTIHFTNSRQLKRDLARLNLL